MTTRIRPPSTRAGVAAALAALLLACSCRDSRERVAGTGDASPEAAAGATPATSRPELTELLRADSDVARHPSDGGGRAWIERQEPSVIHVGERGRWTLVYEAGPLGIAPGGMLLLQVSPFWGWSTPQVEDPAAPGFTTVEFERAGLAARDAASPQPSSADPASSAAPTPATTAPPTLEPSTLDLQLLGIRIANGPLREGDRVRMVYGAGEARALADRFAERRSRFWIGVDGDGDGRRTLLIASPMVDVAAGPPAQVVAHLPSAAEPGATVPLTIAVLDASGSAGVEFAGTMRLSTTSRGVELPAAVEFERDDGGMRRVEVRVGDTDVVRIQVESEHGLESTTNPLVVSPESQRILWADLHGHSNLSDGTGVPEDYFRYARDVAALDVCALTDHDHWGMVPLAQAPKMWKEIRDAVERFEEPGRFVALLGFEWTNWVSGHRHVLWFGDDLQSAAVLDSVDPSYQTPTLLWAALRDADALTVAHHPAGGPVPIDWSIPPDPELEPVVEVVSVHGASEAPDAPIPIYSAVAGRWVRDALDAGYRLGFAGSGDSHDGHPGLAHLASPSGGLSAILTDQRTRAGVREALRVRRVYATNGPRIVLRTVLDGARMGSSVPAAKSHRLQIVVAGTGPIERVDVIQSGGRIDSQGAAGRLFWTLDSTLAPTRPGEYAYVRVVQRDGGAAWSSPFFFE